MSEGSVEPVKLMREKCEILAGQKYKPPPIGEGARVYYETLYKENSSSEVATLWMLEHGMLGEKRAKEV
jgi:hypothetical protein